MKIQKILAGVVLSSFISAQLRAQSVYSKPDSAQLGSGVSGKGLRLLEDRDYGGFGFGPGEFMVGHFPGAVMIPVSLWGATKTSGLFRVPKNTTLTTLLSYARGPEDDAILSDIVIKRSAESKEQTLIVDVERILEKPGTRDVVLQAHDIIYVSAKKSIIDQRWVTVVAFVGSLLAATLAGVAIMDRSK